MRKAAGPASNSRSKVSFNVPTYIDVLAILFEKDDSDHNFFRRFVRLKPLEALEDIGLHLPKELNCFAIPYVLAL